MNHRRSRQAAMRIRSRRRDATFLYLSLVLLAFRDADTLTPFSPPRHRRSHRFGTRTTASEWEVMLVSALHDVVPTAIHPIQRRRRHALWHHGEYIVDSARAHQMHTHVPRTPSSESLLSPSTHSPTPLHSTHSTHSRTPTHSLTHTLSCCCLVFSQVTTVRSGLWTFGMTRSSC